MIRDNIEHLKIFSSQDLQDVINKSQININHSMKILQKFINI